ncbi:MAG: OsmC family peroxiredoxin [Cytophagales bacterium]|nr:MAG: OsmC family peroxiredoxin [Cytophagales bacterium]TAF61147.1 MAG: OsmC family peroxiredoxin [Cytophagales bacterium]
MAKMKVRYEGDIRTFAEHLLSGKTLITDGPPDNHGKGEAFSPTDLMCTSLACCQLSIMGIVAKREGIAIEGLWVDVEKIMQANPRRVAEIRIIYHSPEGLKITAKQKAMLENAAKTCPVGLSLSTDIKQHIEFDFQTI